MGNSTIDVSEGGVAMLPVAILNNRDAPCPAPGLAEREWIARKHGVALTLQEFIIVPEDATVGEQWEETPETNVRVGQESALEIEGGHGGLLDKVEEGHLTQPPEDAVARLEQEEE